VLPLDHFDAIAAGGGVPETTVRLLLSAERSRRLILLRVLLDAVADSPGALGPLPPADVAWDLLSAAQQQPSEFDALLLHPQVGSWVAHCLRRLRGTAWDEAPLWADLGHVFSVACAAAAMAGMPLRTSVAVRKGTVMLPRLGLARLPVSDPWTVADAEVDERRVVLRVPGHEREFPLPGPDTDAWWGLRHLRLRAAGLELAVYLDDVDPFRELGNPIAPARLTAEESGRWQELLDGAWDILTDDDPVGAEALAAGLHSVVPLPPSGSWLPASASTGDAFGAALICLPPDAATLAALLVHEFQHTKLGALYHLTSLYEDDGQERFYAPWRDDPRPLGGLLQGVYAFLGVTGFWRLRRRRATGPELGQASFEFAHWREQTWRTLQVLRADPGLTDLGRRFVAGMADRLGPWQADPVPPDVAAAARIVSLDHSVGWRLRHLRPPHPGVAALADAWITDRAPVRPPPDSVLMPDTPLRWPHARSRLLRLRAAGAPSVDPAPANPPETTPADLALVAGRYEEAVRAYGAQLAAMEEAGPEVWTGFLLALTAIEPGTRTLLERPELLPATSRAIRLRRASPDPRRLAVWLAGVLARQP